MGTFLYLSSADIEALALTPQAMTNAVEQAYRSLAQGGARSVPKTGFDVTASTFFHAMPARYDDAGVIGTKWIGTALNAAKGLPHINAMIVINDIETAVVQGVMDGTVITAVRPAAVSLTAARRLRSGIRAASAFIRAAFRRWRISTISPPNFRCAR